MNEEEKIISLIIFVLCIAYLGYCVIDNYNKYETEEDRIISSISDDGVFCLATAKQNVFTIVLASLKKDGIISRLLFTGYTSQVICLSPKKVMSSDPLKINEMPILFNRKSCWYGFCTEESAKRLKINGEVVETDKVEFSVDKHNYSGYFWFYESVDKPTVELV